MMAFFGHDYYVGFLSAAAIHGASHQSPMVNQIATPALLRNRYIGRSRVQFIRRAQTAQSATQRHLVPTGRINVSTPEVTVLDLVESPLLGAGISNVATVIGDLIVDPILETERLAIDARSYPITVAQRAGHLLDFMCEELDVTLDIGPLRRLVSKRHHPPLLFAQANPPPHGANAMPGGTST